MFADSAFIGAHVFLIEEVRKIINATLTPIFCHPTSYPITRLLTVMDSRLLLADAYITIIF
jgi:hypothetical protein